MVDTVSTIPSNIPIPDPSAVTTQALDRIKLELRNEFKIGIIALQDSIVARLDGMDKAVALLAEGMNRVPTQLDRETSRLQALSDERFRSVALQFAERDVRADKAETAAKEAQSALSVASTTAVNAALQAQKESAFATQQSNAEAIRKSETGFTNEITSIKTLITASKEGFSNEIKAVTTLIAATKDGLAGNITELRSRLDRGEGSTTGARESSTDAHMNIGSVMSIVVGIIGLLALLASVAALGLSHTTSQYPPTGSGGYTPLPYQSNSNYPPNGSTPAK